MNKLKKLLKFNLSHMACLFISLIMLVGIVVYAMTILTAGVDSFSTVISVFGAPLTV